MKKRLPYYLLITCTVLLVWALAGTPVQADMIKGETALGGMSKALSDFYDRGGRLYEEEELRLLSSLIWLENGNNSDYCMLLTGSVVLNRVASKWFPNSIEAVINQKGQYSTAKKINNIEAPARAVRLAKQLLIGGSIAESDVVFQAMFRQGSSVYYSENGEYFCRW